MSARNKARRSEIAKAIRAKAQELYAYPESWCQREMAKDKDGNQVNVYDPKATQRCALGHLALLPMDTRNPAIIATIAALPLGKSIPAYNDSVSVEKIVDLFNKAADIVEEGKIDVGPLWG